MAIVGFNFNKILIEKIGALKGSIDIKNNVSIKDVLKKPVFLGTAKQEALAIIFSYVSNYEADKKKIAYVDLEGEILVMDDAKKIKENLDLWAKSKKIDKQLMLNVMNTALTKCNIEALTLTKELNLPPPIPLPRVTSESDASKYIG